MIAVNKNLSNLNMYDTLAFMFNDGRTSSTANANTKIGRFSSGSYIEVRSDNSYPQRYCYGVTDGVVQEIFNLRFDYNRVSGSTYWRGMLNINGVNVGAFGYSNWTYHQTLGFDFKYINNILTITSAQSGSYSISTPNYDYIYFSHNLANCTDLIIFDESQNYFITNQDGITLLDKMNKELYNANTSVSSLLTSYSGFLTSLTSVKSYMLTNGLITTEESDAPFHSLDKPAIKYKYDKNNRVVNFYSKRPISVIPSFTHNSTDELYIVHIPKSLNSDSILTQFLNTTTNLPVNQFIVNKFKIGTPSNSDGCDIIIDYINRIDTIDEININVKLSNIIN